LERAVAQRPRSYELGRRTLISNGPHVDLHCKGGLGPWGFGLTGPLLSALSKISPRTREHGVLILYPQQICENASVRFYARQKRPGGVMRTEAVSYSLQGLA